MPDVTINIKRSAVNDVYYPCLTDKSRIKLLYGGRFAGKSDYAALHKLLRCMHLDRFMCILVRKKFNQIKDSNYAQLREVAIRYGIADFFEWKTSPLEIVCKINGHKFIARGCDDPLKLKSITGATDAWYEEAEQIEYQDWITISTTIRGGDDLEELFTFNPEPTGEVEKFWMYTTFFEGQSTKSFKDTYSSTVKVNGRDMEVSYDYVAIHSTIDDNRWATLENYATLERLKSDPYYYTVWYLGEWAQKQVENRFFNLYDPKEHESTAVHFDPTKKVYLSLDFNLNPFAFIFSHVWRDEMGLHWHVFDEASIENASIPKAIEYIKTKYGHVLHNIEVTGDKAGNARQLSQVDNASYFLQLERGLGVRKNQIKLYNSPKHSNSRADCNYVFTHYPDLKINPKACPNLCRDLISVEADNYGSIVKKDRKKANQRADHGDAFRYQVNASIIYDWISQDQKAVARRK